MLAFVLIPLVVAAALAVALVIARRSSPDAPTGPASYAVPAQIDRSDFDGQERPWLVAVFTSSSCSSCADVLEKAIALESESVAVEEVEFTARRDLHERYDIEAVPMLLVADSQGVVRGSFIGTPSASELWSAVADIRANTDQPADESASESASEK